MKFLLSLIGLLFLDALWFEKYIIDWKRFDISDGKKDSLKIIQLTDLHIDEVRSFHKSIAKRINKEQPDILFITGDSVNYNGKLPVLNNFLNLIDRKIPKLAILGNKEYQGNVDIANLKKVYEQNNCDLLINENRMFDFNGRSLNIIGLDDYIRGNADFYEAAISLDNTLDTIVLNHCPQYRDEIERINKNLRLNLKIILSGHTHGGQIVFFGKALFKPTGSGRYLKGWYKSKETQMYVSKGVGTSIVPIRIGSRAEVTIFNI